ncbi:ABC transporter substrate-binding protein [Salarchaeum sp. JOR-1]|uniref:ABC transporter substrate-binding protein n=1 Tax=Salarchaeum sp. JOR-1 TaxID=2599399 RepID=UPI00119890AA|nr:ABC transporter substrate-binding protein [Salarchaeum sp. JOR-1]QDX41731.1 ABC transporter substrate-binding protein [Salarchaeum sp. JOR-1]
MASDSGERDDTTRRRYLAATGALAGSALLAGCQSESDATTDGTTSTTTDATTRATTDSGAYSVSMAPVGEVAFEEPPSNVMVYSLLYADMAVAYGHGDAVNSLGFSTNAAGSLHAYYDRLDGVSFDQSGLTQLNQGGSGITVDKEVFYDLNSDLHLIDPALVVSFDGWEASDVQQIADDVAPWFGNVYSRRNTEPPEAYADSYEYYTLWEIAETVSQVFQAQARYDALAAIHDDVVATIQSTLPPESERPTVASVIFIDGTFYPSTFNADGFAHAHTRPMRAPGAFAESDVSYRSAYDYETMLEVDPDVIINRYSYSYYDITSVRQTLAESAVGSRLTAVENDRVYAGGNPLQGPVMNLFQLEMTAKQLYPEQFGEWPGYDGGPYPEIPEDEQLFDRDEVAAIVNGDLS